MAVYLANFSLSFITFVLNLMKELIKDSLPKFLGLLLCSLCNSHFVLPEEFEQIYQIYKVSIFTEKKIQESDNKIAIYQYIIYRLGFAVACVGFGSLVLVWCIFVSCLFLGFGFYS